MNFKNALPIVPHFQSAFKAFIQPQPSSIYFNTYTLGQKDFAKLADLHTFREHQTSCIAVDITQECHLMTEESYLEVSVPVLSLNDLMGQSTYFNQKIMHPVLSVINGFGSKDKEDKENNFPYVDFVNVFDIADNRFELIVDPSGEVEWPKQGAGLFSVIKEITYILSYRQIINGEGLENFRNQGGRENWIYVLPPFGTKEDFTFHISVTHLDKKNYRIVDSIRSINSKYLLPSHEGDLPVLTPSMMYAKFDTPQNELDKKYPDWKPHPVCPNIWFKRCGLQPETRMQILKTLYNEHEFIRDFLTKNGLVFSTLQNYNNFILRPESFQRIYEGLIHDLAHGYIKIEFLKDKLAHDSLSRMPLTILPQNFHDKIVLMHLLSAYNNPYDFLCNMLLPILDYNAKIIPFPCQYMALMPIDTDDKMPIPDLPIEWHESLRPSP